MRGGATEGGECDIVPRTMAKFPGGGFRGKFAGGGHKRPFQSGGRDDRPRMHAATCSDCGKACEVPFRPTGERPVYCRDCFPKHRDEQGGGERGRRDFPPRDRGPREHGPIGYPPPHAPHHPPHERPPHHDRPGQVGSPALADLKRAVEALSVKVDKLTAALEARGASASAKASTLTSVVKAATKKAKKASSKKK